MKRTALITLITIAATACREGVTPFSDDARTPLSGSLIQLTFNPGDDLNPAWSTNSDTVYYTANAFFDAGKDPSSIVRVGRTGGTSDIIARGGVTPLVLPVSSPQRDRVAYVQINYPIDPAFCPDTFPPAPSCRFSEPLLETGTLRVRSANANGNAGFDAGTSLNFQGVDPRRTQRLGGPYTQRLFPFQRAFRNNVLVFRPSWAPDGQRIAFSDGLSLRTWTATESQPSTLIPNTTDGVSPAWSPDGTAIAFTRLVRVDSVRTTCACYEPSQVNPDVYTRWVYTNTRSVITLIKPDGTGATELTEGAEPAWSPDGGTIYFTKDGQIFRIPRAGGSPSAVAQTAGGRAPSVSPDGKWLAFTKGTTVNDITTDQNVWLLSLISQ